MKATVSAIAVAAALLSAACGEGRAIFNVDVYSFIAGTGSDTIPYLVPPGLPDTVSNAPQEIRLPPGLGNSIVDSVRFSGGANLINSTGAGTIGIQIFLAATSAGTMSPAALALNIPPVNVSGTNTTPLVILGDLTGAFKDLFAQSSVWIRVAAIGNNPGVTPVTGDAAITGLQVRVVLQERLF